MTSREYKPINKYLMAVTNGGSYTRIEPNIFEAVKAECIAHAKGILGKFLPYFSLDYDADILPDLHQWRMSFTSDNPPERIKFDSTLEQLIKDVDFSKPYDAALAEAIRGQFLVKSRSARNVDADLIIQGELGELPEQER